MPAPLKAFRWPMRPHSSSRVVWQGEPKWMIIGSFYSVKLTTRFPPGTEQDTAHTPCFSGALMNCLALLSRKI
jgi:hypothetical protein